MEMTSKVHDIEHSLATAQCRFVEFFRPKVIVIVIVIAAVFAAHFVLLPLVLSVTARL